MKLHCNTNKKMNQVTLWNLFLGVVGIPINIVVASSLANAVSAVANSSRELCLHHTTLFVVFSFVRLLLSVFQKTHISRLISKANQSYIQSLYLRFMEGNSSLHKVEPNSFSTLFRRDAQQVFTFYAETLPTCGIAIIGFVSYTFYICLSLKGSFFVICMVILGLLSLLQPIILEKFLIKNFIEADRAESELAQHLTSGRNGFAVLKLFKLHEWYMNKYRTKQKSFWHAGVRASASGTFNQTMGDINKFLQTLGLVSILGWAILNQWTTFQVAMQIFVISPNIYSYVTTIFHIKKDSSTYIAALNQVNKYIPPKKYNIEGLPIVENTLVELCVSNLCYEANGKVLMKDVSFKLSPGEKCLFRGENGAGKSTFLALIMGETAPTSGQITINGEVVIPDLIRFRNWISYCPQVAPNLHCTAHELYDSVISTQANLSEQLLFEYATELGLLVDELDKPINTLSGGTQKKVILCMALAKQTPLLLLDEPEAMLDQTATERLLNILSRRKSTMIIVSHTHLYENVVHSLLTFNLKSRPNYTLV